MDAGKRLITDIFNQARVLEIPFFQRSYVWERENWERFLEDLLATAKSPKPYFLGSIILKQRPTGANQLGDVRAVIDGQQRLTSLVLLFRVLCPAGSALFDKLFFNLQGQLILQHNHNDIEVFNTIATGAAMSEHLLRRFSGNRVLEAFQYFQSRSDQLADIDPMTLVTSLYFVGIDLGHDEDEQQIFDTINSLGVDLTTAELLKNELFERKHIDLFKRTWQPTFEESENTRQYWSCEVAAGRSHRENIDLFLQAFLLNQPNISDDVRVASLFQEYRQHLRASISDREAFIRDLVNIAQVYRKNIDPRRLDQAPDMRSAVDRMNIVVFALQTTTVLPLLLRILAAVPSPTEQERMVGLVESYIIRRLIAGSPSNYYNQFFSDLVRQRVSSFDDLASAIAQSNDPSRRLPADSEVAEGFAKAHLTNLQARVILYLLEGSIRDESRHVASLASFSHYTLEHVMPKKWPNHWGALTEERSRERDQAVRTLGNMTLLSAALNRDIRDAAWRQKLRGTDRHGGLLRYGRGLEIFDAELERSEWTEDVIRERGEQLAQYALRVWPLPN